MGIYCKEDLPVPEMRDSFFKFSETGDDDERKD
jgi:hypothetical protein